MVCGGGGWVWGSEVVCAWLVGKFITNKQNQKMNCETCALNALCYAKSVMVMRGISWYHDSFCHLAA